MREHYEFNLHDDERKPGKVRRILKKTTAVALTAVMAGTLAVGGMNVLGHNSIVSAEEKQRAVLKTAVGTEESSDIQTTETGLSAETESSAVADLVEETLPSIVAISTLSIQEVQNYYRHSPNPERSRGWRKRYHHRKERYRASDRDKQPCNRGHKDDLHLLRR